jgi:thioredoxin-dependent peroxiredoxin
LLLQWVAAAQGCNVVAALRTTGRSYMIGRRVPAIVFKTRVRDESIGGSNPYRWQDLRSEEIFNGRRTAVFALPGAFTPVCSQEQCPAYERHYSDIRAHGIDEVFCISVNDAFVMFQWGKHLSIKNVKLLPDGSGHFTRRMGMLVNKDHLGFGYRSWRYSMVVRDGVIEKFFEEPGINDNGADDDPYTVTSPEVMIEYLRGAKRESSGESRSRAM